MGDSFNPLFSDNKIRLSDNDYEEKLEKRQSLQSVRISSSTDNSLAADIKKSFFHKIAVSYFHKSQTVYYLFHIIALVE
jgi:hypothetical protein